MQKQRVLCCTWNKCIVVWQIGRAIWQGGSLSQQEPQMSCWLWMRPSGLGLLASPPTGFVGKCANLPSPPPSLPPSLRVQGASWAMGRPALPFGFPRLSLPLSPVAPKAVLSPTQNVPPRTPLASWCLFAPALDFPHCVGCIVHPPKSATLKARAEWEVLKAMVPAATLPRPMPRVAAFPGHLAFVPRGACKGAPSPLPAPLLLARGGVS